MIDAQAQSLIRKAAWRIVPFAILLFFVTYLDRVNVGYAALTMNRDIGLSATAFGLGAGVFFLGYFLFEIPSNLILERVGPRRWIARIMVTWGLLSGLTAFVTGPTSFYIVRFLLGVAEAGFFPGMILYLTYWFPGPARAKIMGLFLLAVPLSTVIGAPVSTSLLGLSLFGLKGWQTMFLLEALPSVILGVAVLFMMTDRPADARWLDEGEKARLTDLLKPTGDAAPDIHGLRQGLFDRRVWLFSAIYLGVVLGLYGLNFWLPQIIKGFGVTNQQVGLLTIAPYALAAVAMVAWGAHSDARGERVWHFCLPALLGAAGVAASGLTHDPWLSLVALSIGAIGICAALSVFWTLPTAILAETAAAASIALINSIGNLGGYFGPFLMGRLKDATGGYAAGLFALGVCIAASGLLALAASRVKRPARAP